MKKEILEIRFERIFNGIYQFDANLIKNARNLQKAGNGQESIEAYQLVVSTYGEKLKEALNIEPQARTTVISPLCIVEESKFDAGLKQGATIYEYSAKLCVAEAMIAELTGEGEVKTSLEKAADFYRKEAANLSSLAGGCNEWEDMAQIMFESEARTARYNADAILGYLNPQEIKRFPLDAESKRRWLNDLYGCLSCTALNVWTIPMRDNDKACRDLWRAFSFNELERKKACVADAQQVCPSFLSAHALSLLLLAILDESNNVAEQYESCLSSVARQVEEEGYHQRIHHLFTGMIASIEMEDVDQLLAYCTKLAEYLPNAEREVRETQFKGRYWSGYGDPVIPVFKTQELVSALLPH